MTKYLAIIMLGLLLGLSATSCKEEDPFKGDDKEHIDDPNIIPLDEAEQLQLYSDLLAYVPNGMLFGCGVDMDAFLNNAGGSKYRSYVLSNFNAATVGYHMKHGAMVNGTGEISYTRVDQFLGMLPDSVDLYGHTLLWHSNQNASYLNGLVADLPDPTTEPEPASLLTNSGFENDLTAWTIPYNEQKFSVNEDKVHVNFGSKSLKVEVGETDGTDGNVTIQSPEFQVKAGHRYALSFYVKADVAGQKIGLNFSSASLGNQYPWLNGADGGKVITATSWTKYTYDAATVNGENMMTATEDAAMTFNLNLGMAQNTVCYLDGFALVDLDDETVTEPAYTNLVADGTFDAGVSNWAAWNGGAAALAHETIEKHGGAGAMKIVTAAAGNEWDVQVHADFTTSPLTAEHTYMVSFWIKSEAAGAGRLSTSGTTAQYQSAFNTSTAWTEVTWSFTGNGTETGINFDMGKTAGTYYIDDFLIYDETAETSRSLFRAAPMRVAKNLVPKVPIRPKGIPLSEEVKSEKIDTALVQWIRGVMTKYKSRVTAWDVVNEPISDGGEIRHRSNSPTDATDAFFWQDYIKGDGGEDRAAFVKAFKYARQYGNGASDKLFMNDYNLEYSVAKLDKFIQLSQWIETQDVVIDGLGTQMHVSLTTFDSTKVDEMFKKLAATGKLVKVSELDVATGSATPSPEQMQQQAAIYKFIVESYIRNVPEVQRYGITIWGVADGASKDWLPDQAPLIWDKDYARKPAYKGVADALAGKDVGAEFTYDDLKTNE